MKAKMYISTKRNEFKMNKIKEFDFIQGYHHSLGIFNQMFPDSF